MPENVTPITTSFKVSREDVVQRIVDQINRVLPADPVMKTVKHNTPVSEAISLMNDKGYSQMPVEREDGNIIGMFSLRNFSKRIIETNLKDLNADRMELGDFHVSEFLEDAKFFQVDATIGSVFKTLDEHDAILVGTPETVVGILSPMDFVKYLYDVASPFVLLTEIELGIREIIRRRMTPEEIQGFAFKVNSHMGGDEGSLPKRLSDMTLSNYIRLITYAECFNAHFKDVFSARRFFASKLERLPNLRNEIFHFRRLDLQYEEYEYLRLTRDYIFQKIGVTDSMPFGRAAE